MLLSARPTCGRIRSRSLRLITLAILGILAAAGRPALVSASTVAPTIPGLNKTACVYSSDHISMLQAFGRTVGRQFRCAMVFNDAAPDWRGWVDPWFINRTYADMSWASWASAPGMHRRLIITQNLFPASEDHADWLRLGAQGRWTGDARTLAANLVRAGLGSSVIRLAHEANGTWYPDSIPATPGGDRLWVRFWQRTVTAMRSVHGAHFEFDWCVNAGTRDVPLSSFYPGNRYVDIVGVDAYDSGVSAGPHRWARLYGEGDGLKAVRAFARAHGKPLSIPEWGIGPSALDQGGDDPAYVRGIASVIRDSDVAFQSYFDADAEMLQFYNSPHAIRAYAQAFGDHQMSVRASRQATQALAPPRAPWLRITGGPRYASVLTARATTFDFAAQPGYTPSCSLDGQPFRPCSTTHEDALNGLSPGFHTWTVRLANQADLVSLLGRVFVVR